MPRNLTERPGPLPNALTPYRLPWDITVKPWNPTQRPGPLRNALGPYGKPWTFYDLQALTEHAEPLHKDLGFFTDLRWALTEHAEPFPKDLRFLPICAGHLPKSLGSYRSPWTLYQSPQTLPNAPDPCP
jgi:hypothetical protein